MGVDPFSRIQWITMVILILQSCSLTTASICQTCEDCTEFTDQECFCEKYIVYRLERTWDRYEGYRNLKVKLYDYSICKNVKQDSILDSQISEDTNIKYVTFVESSVQIIPTNFFLQLSSVEEIYINSSEVSNIQVGAFSALTEIKVLHLEGNKLSKIMRGWFNSLVSLKTLDLHNNRIKSIEVESFHGLSSLEYLNLAKNELSMIEGSLFSSVRALETIDISSNALKTADFQLADLPKLRVLLLNKNSLENLKDFFPTSLQVLHLSDNNISFIDPKLFENMNELYDLNLSNNKINDIQVQLFKGLENLKSLSISSNNITDLTAGVFSGLKNLKSLDLKSLNLNKFEGHIFVSLSSLNELNIESNNLDFLDNSIFEFCPNLNTIYIDGNNFSCSMVASMILNSIKYNFTIMYTQNYDDENLDGIPCIRNVGNSAEQSYSKQDISVDLISRNLSEIFHIQIQESFDELLQNISNQILGKNNGSDFDIQLLHAIEKLTNESGNIDLKKNYEVLRDILTSEHEDQNHSFEAAKIHYAKEENSLTNLTKRIDDAIHSINLLILVLVVSFSILFVAIFVVFSKKKLIQIFCSNKKVNVNVSHELPILSSAEEIENGCIHQIRTLES